MTSDTTSAELVDGHGGRFAVRAEGNDAAGLELVWLHGWGQTAASFAELSAGQAGRAENLLVDLPGFGAAPLPPPDWDTADYALGLAEWLDTRTRRRRVLIGHSFGCRVAIRLAKRRPDLVDGMVLIAAAGLKRQRSLAWRLRAAILKLAGRLVKLVDRLAGTSMWQAYAMKAGSADYRNAGEMRPVFVRAVNEDLTDEAAELTLPVLLVYGADDTETPPEFGRRYAALMGDADTVELPGFDHLGVLSRGRHQVAKQITAFLDRIGS